MSAFQPGDIVDVTITDLEVIGVDGTRTDCDYIKVQKPWRDHLSALHIPFDHPAVTITRRAPQPQADLLAAVSELHNAIKESKNAEAVKIGQGLNAIAAAIRNVTSAALANEDTRAEVPMLRRFEDNDGDVWVETAPSSNEYQSEKSPSGSRGEIDGDYGIRRDLHSFPADAEAVR